MLLRPIRVVLWPPGIRLGVLFNTIGRVVLMEVFLYIYNNDEFMGQLILAQRSLSMVQFKVFKLFKMDLSSGFGK